MTEEALKRANELTRYIALGEQNLEQVSRNRFLHSQQNSVQRLHYQIGGNSYVELLAFGMPMLLDVFLDLYEATLKAQLEKWKEEKAAL